MTIKELKYDDSMEEIGVYAVSLVSDPAIEENFQYFNKQKKEEFLNLGPGMRGMTDTQRLMHPIYGWKFWKYETRSNLPPVLPDATRDFCKDHVDKIYHITEIRNWNQEVIRTSGWDKGWNFDSSFTSQFNGTKSRNFNLDQQMYNCRHFLRPVRRMSDVINAGKEHLVDLNFKKQKVDFKFEIVNEEKRLISGPVMVPNKMMLRRGLKTPNDYYYVYFSKDTIQKFKEKYGWKRNTTYEHQSEITGTSILMDSWLFKTEKDDNCGIENLKEGTWCMKYKIVSNKLWEKVKSGEVKGFSVEIMVGID